MLFLLFPLPRLDENANLKSTEAGLKADFKLASEDRAVLRLESERLKSMVCTVRHVWHYSYAFRVHGALLTVD